MITRVSNRIRLACAGVAVGALYGDPALAQGQGIFEQMETQGTAAGRAASTWSGPLFYGLCIIIGAASIWAIYQGSHRHNKGQGLYAMGIIGLVAAGLAAGYVGLTNRSANTTTGGNATATIQPMTLAR